MGPPRPDERRYAAPITSGGKSLEAMSRAGDRAVLAGVCKRANIPRHWSGRSPRSAATAILTGHCLACHGPDQKKGGLDLSRRATALKGGKSGVVLVPGGPMTAS